MKNYQLLSKTQGRLYQTERIEKILKILEEKGYVTVKYLTDALNYSNATVNRDLQLLEKQALIKRSYGGVELKDIAEPLSVRYQKMKGSKLRIAKKAAEFIQNGDTVFIDGSTTAEYIGQYLLDKKDLTVITNNMALVSYLSEYSVNAVCLGGPVVEKPYMLCGPETVANVRHYHADKLFFSTGGICKNGTISFGGIYGYLDQAMMDHADQIFYLADHDKIKSSAPKVKQFDELDYIIVDFPIDPALKEKFKTTTFIEV